MRLSLIQTLEGIDVGSIPSHGMKGTVDGQISTVAYGTSLGMTMVGMVARATSTTGKEQDGVAPDTIRIKEITPPRVLEDPWGRVDLPDLRQALQRGSLGTITTSGLHVKRSFAKVQETLVQAKAPPWGAWDRP